MRSSIASMRLCGLLLLAVATISMAACRRTHDLTGDYRECDKAGAPADIRIKAKEGGYVVFFRSDKGVWETDDDKPTPPFTKDFLAHLPALTEGDGLPEGMKESKDAHAIDGFGVSAYPVGAMLFLQMPPGWFIKNRQQPVPYDTDVVLVGPARGALLCRVPS